MDKVIHLWQAILKIFTDLKNGPVGKMLLECNVAFQQATKVLLLVEIFCLQINLKKVEHFKWKFFEYEVFAEIQGFFSCQNGFNLFLTGFRENVLQLL